MKRNLIKKAVIVAALAATTSLVSGSPEGAPVPAANESIVGVWQVRRSPIPDCVHPLPVFFRALMTFNNEGTLGGYAVPPGFSPANISTEQGVWKREPGFQTYSFRFIFYAYDDSGAFDGSGVVTATVQLAADGNSFTYDAIIELYDADGNLIESRCGHATAERFE